jgi:hypothetical protein
MICERLVTGEDGYSGSILNMGVVSRDAVTFRETDDKYPRVVDQFEKRQPSLRRCNADLFIVEMANGDGWSLRMPFSMMGGEAAGNQQGGAGPVAVESA